jgi:hypothetical protein
MPAQGRYKPTAREKFAAYATGQNPYLVYEQREQLKKIADRENLFKGLELFNSVLGMPPGPMRKFAAKKFAGLWEQTTGTPFDPEFIKLIETVDADDAAALQEFFVEFAAKNPELGAKGLARLAATRPDLAIKAMGAATGAYKERRKAEGDAETRQILKEAFGGGEPSAEGLPGAPGGPQGEFNLEGIPESGIKPQAGPRASQGAPEDIQKIIVDTAQEFGVDPKLALAVAKVESGFDPNAVSPTGVAGLFQVTNATGARFGQTPQTRNDPQVSARAGIGHLAELLRFTNGNIELALRQYNGPVEQGGDPQYVQKVLGAYEGDYPVSQSVQEAPAQYTQRLKQLDVGITKLETVRQKLLPGSGDPEVNSILDNLDKHLTALRAERKDLVDRFKPQVSPGFAEFVYSQTGKRLEDTPAGQRRMLYAQYQNAEEAQATRIQRARGAAQNESDIIGPEVAHQVRNPTIGAGTTKAQLAKMEQEQPGSTRPLKDAPAAQVENLQLSRAGVTSIDRIIDTLTERPELARVIGTIFSNPEGAVDRVASEYFDGKMSPEERLFVARLTTAAGTYRRSYTGLATTRPEIQLAAPAIPLPSDVDRESVLAKLFNMRENLIDSQHAIVDELTEQEYKAPKKLAHREFKTLFTTPPAAEAPMREEFRQQLQDIIERSKQRQGAK